MEGTHLAATRRLFNKVLITAPNPRHERMNDLQIYGSLCTELTTLVGYDEDSTHNHTSSSTRARRPSAASQANDPTQRSAQQVWANIRHALRRRSRGSMSSTRPDPQINTPRSSSAPPLLQRAAENEQRERAIERWTMILSWFPYIDTLTIRVRGDTSWPGLTRVENTLLVLRVALELTQPRQLKRLRFQPAHAMTILVFKWHGFGAIARAPASLVWRNITRLDLQLHNPMESISQSQGFIFIKSLHEYLSSFSDTLIKMRFIWLTTNGPNPLCLELEDELRNWQHAIEWSRLEELWLGNASMLYDITHLIRARAPVLRRLKTLSLGVPQTPTNFEAAECWVEVMLPQDHSAQAVQDQDERHNNGASTPDPWA